MKILKQVAEYGRLVTELEEKIETLKEYKTLYIETYQQLIESDQRAENLQHNVNTLDKTLKRITKENEHLKALLIGEWK